MTPGDPQNAPSRGELVVRAVDAIVSYCDGSEAMNDAAATYLGLSRSEVRCLGAIQRGPLSASEIAKALYLTRGAITALVDRLEARGFAERQSVSDDRRRVNIAITPEAQARLGEIWGPLVSEGSQYVTNFSDEQLATIADWLAAAGDLQRRHARRVRGMANVADEDEAAS